MKKLLLILPILFTLLLISCEDSIHVDTDTAAPRMVVDALLVWPKGTAGNEQKIKLTTTGDYYTTNVPIVSGANVTVKNSVGTIFDFIETPNTGEYLCSTFIPEIDETYTLTILINGQTLIATETLKSVVPIDYMAQETTPGIGEEEDQIEVKTYFTDPATSDDFYMIRSQASISAIPDFDVFDDEFFQGNQVFGLYQNEDLKPGDLLEVTLYGISERYMNYMAKLLNITENSGPFNTPPATLRGNITNSTNPDNYVLGYFNLSETDTKTYTVQ